MRRTLVTAVAALATVVACSSDDGTAASPSRTPAPADTPPPSLTASPTPAATRTEPPTTTPAATPEPAPVIGTTTEVDGSRYTVHEVRDPAPPGIFGIPQGQRLIAIDLTQEALDDGVTANSLNISVQDANGFIYIRGIEVGALTPGFAVGPLAAGQQQRGWIAIPVPEDAIIVTVFAEADLLSEAVPIASIAD